MPLTGDRPSYNDAANRISSRTIGSKTLQQQHEGPRKTDRLFSHEDMNNNQYLTTSSHHGGSNRSRPVSAQSNQLSMPGLANSTNSSITSVQPPSTETRRRRGSDVPQHLQPQHRGMIKSSSFDTHSRSGNLPELYHNSSSQIYPGHGVNAFNSSSGSTSSRTHTPELPRRASHSRRGSDMIKTRSYDVEDSRITVAPGVAVHGTGPRTVLQRELETLSAVTRRLNDSGDGFSSNVLDTHSNGSGNDSPRSTDMSSRTLSPPSLRTSTDTYLHDRGHGGKLSGSRRGSGDLDVGHYKTLPAKGSVDLRPKVAHRLPDPKPANLSKEITETSHHNPADNNEEKDISKDHHHPFRNLMDAMFPKKRPSIGKSSGLPSLKKSSKDTDNHADVPKYEERDDARKRNSRDVSRDTTKTLTDRGSEFPARRRRYTLNDFDIHEQIGKGAFARVHLVRIKTPPDQQVHRSLTKIYAMKSLRKPDIVATKQVKHVMNEKTLLESIRHPFVVELMATFQDPRHLYLIMEYIQGGDMFTHLRRNKRFSEPVARFYTVELVLAMEHIHSKGIIYRDLKPENVLLDKDGHIKIADFGFARSIGTKEKAITFCGTPAYMAPEIILKVGYTKSVDWWSLGIVCYELQAGYSPFQAETPLQIYEKIMDGNMRWSSQIGAVSKDLLSRFFEMEPMLRLGSEGAREVKAHSWFRDVDWKAHEARKVPVPYKPNVKDDEDISNFDVYQEQSSVVKMQKGTLELGPDDSAYDEYFKDF